MSVNSAFANNVSAQNTGDPPRSPEAAQSLNSHIVVLYDNANINGVIKGFLGGRWPSKEERPDLERLLEAFQEHYDSVHLLVFRAVSSESTPPWGFARHVETVGGMSVLIEGERGEQADDFAILRTLEAIEPLAADVAVLSHDHGFAELLTRLAQDGRRVEVIGFREMLAGIYHQLENEGILRIFDLEDDFGAINTPLPRKGLWTRSSFDPAAFLSGIPLRTTESAMNAVASALEQQDDRDRLAQVLENAWQAFYEQGLEPSPDERNLLQEADLRLREQPDAKFAPGDFGGSECTADGWPADREPQ